MNDIWTTRDMRLFIRRGEDVQYVPACIEGIAFYCQRGKWICPYCTVENESSGSFCIGCQAPKPTGIHMGEVTVMGNLPHALLLDSLQDEYTLEVTARRCRRPDEYFSDEVVLKVENCQTVQKFIPKLMSYYMDEYQAVELVIVVSGKVTLIHDPNR